MEVLSDNHLMLQVKNGQISQLGLLYERHHQQLLGFFYHMTGDRAVSEDLVQSVFYRMLKYRNSYQGEGKFKYWMYRMARNVNADRFRKPNPLLKKKGYDEIAEPSSQEANAQYSLEKQEQLKLLQQALRRLSPEKREALVLSRYQGLKYKEIAKISQTSENAIKTRIHRALQELKEIYFQLEKSA